MMFNVLLADNHLVFRRGLALLLQAYPEFQIVGEATNSVEVSMLVASTQPDILILDYGMMNDSGKINKTYRAILSEFKSLVLTGTERGHDFLALLDAGARGYICRDTDIESLIEAMRAVLVGHVVCSPEMANNLADGLSGDGKRLYSSPLSVRQQDVLELIAKGCTNKEIATQLTISQTTVKAHIQSIMEKLRVKNRGQAVAHAVHAGLIHNGLFKVRN